MNKLRSISFNITAEDQGDRVDYYLMKKKGISRRVIIDLKKLPQGMLLNGEHIRTIDTISEGDVLSVNLPEKEKPMPPCDTFVEICYEDEDVIVYNKPPDMPVHQSGGHIYGTLSSVYATHCKEAGISAPFRAVNRLDKDTSGAVVVAKNQIAAGILWKAVKKRYYCITEGIFKEKQGRIHLPIMRAVPMEMLRIVDPDGEDALTEYRVLAEGDNVSFVECILHTGKTHQIRVHMSYIGHPLVGDEMYGNKSPLISRQALHCGRVMFNQPISQKPLDIMIELPDDIKALAEKTGLTLPDIFKDDKI